uniref:2-C-methyl-D-erythritol 4-phosphate cytidylyltransferase n=1 Tax=candidate division WOR-3 bacterium TaxID=2052148 RepID=A0A7C4UG96_UNCW3
MIRDCHKRAFRENYIDATDDASLLVRYGYEVKIFEGDPKNIKITDITDLYLFEKLIDEGRI